MKTKIIMGIGLLAAITLSGAIGAFASDENYVNNSHHISYDNETIDKTNYSFNKGLQKLRDSYNNENAEQRLETGEITQEEYDNIKAMAHEKHHEISLHHEELSDMSPCERHAYYAEN